MQLMNKGGKIQTTGGFGGGRGKSIQQIAFETHLSSLGAKGDEIKKINATIDELV